MGHSKQSKSSWLGQCLTSGSIFGHSRDDFSMTSRLQHFQYPTTTTHQEFHHQQSKEQSRVITYQKKTKSNSRHWTKQVLNLTLNLNLGCRETNHYTPEYDVVWGRRDLDWMGEEILEKQIPWENVDISLSFRCWPSLHLQPCMSRCDVDWSPALDLTLNILGCSHWMRCNQFSCQLKHNLIAIWKHVPDFLSPFLILAHHILFPWKLIRIFVILWFAVD